MGGNERRRTLVVNKEAQKRIVFAVSLFPALALAMATMIIAVFCRKLMGEAARTEAALPSLVPLFISSLGFALVSILIIFNQALRFSHRIAGPAYRLRQACSRIMGGDISFRVQLRKGDHLTEVADSLNDLLEWLNEHPPDGVEVLRDLDLNSVAAPQGQIDTGDAPRPVESAMTEA